MVASTTLKHETMYIYLHGAKVYKENAKINCISLSQSAPLLSKKQLKTQKLLHSVTCSFTALEFVFSQRDIILVLQKLTIVPQKLKIGPNKCIVLPCLSSICKKLKCKEL